MLGSADHYVPILKSKAAELRALNHLTVMERSRVTPLLEIIPGQVSTKRQLETLTKQRDDARGLKDALFIHVFRVGNKKNVLDQIRSSQLKLIPVVSLQDQDTYHKLILSFDRACLRLDVEDLLSGEPSTKLSSLLEKLRKKASDVDVILDFGAIERALRGTQRRSCQAAIAAVTAPIRAP